MIEQRAVVAVRAGRYAWVRVPHPARCCHCAAGPLAAALTWRRPALQAPIKADNVVRAQIGEEVVIRFPERALLHAAMLVYGIPLLSLLFFSSLGERLARSLALDNPDPLSIGLGVCALAGAYLVLGHWRRPWSMEPMPVLARPARCQDRVES